MKYARFKLRDKLTVLGLVVTFALSLVTAMSISKRVYFFSKASPLTKATIHTSRGDIKIKFRTDTPRTVENFIKLSQEGFYDGTRIHRIVPDFLIEGGDPLSKFDINRSEWGKGGPGYTFPDEIHADDQMLPGTVAMVNSGPNTNGSKFFILTKHGDWLNQHNTIFAYVIDGMDIVTAISTLPAGPTGIPLENVTIANIDLE